MAPPEMRLTSAHHVIGRRQRLMGVDRQSAAHAAANRYILWLLGGGVVVVVGLLVLAAATHGVRAVLAW
jgi:hypothetical protein